MLENAQVASRSKLNESFAEALQYALIRKFKQVPTAAFIANGFNHFTNYHQDISRETVRKWLTGKTIPELDRLKILQEWLEMDLNGFGNNYSAKPEPNPFTHDANLERIQQRYQRNLEQLRHAIDECIKSFEKTH